MNIASRRALIGLLALVVLSRLATLGFSPLFDPSEGRYAEIGREMVVSGDWVTPKLDSGHAFLGKPPLHFWLTAASYKIFGINEFAARFPSFLGSVVILMFVGLVARRFYGRDVALWASVVFYTSFMIFVGAAYVVTDMTLAMTITGSLASFLMFYYAQTRAARMGWGHLGFLFLGLGMLAKGPVSLVIFGFALVLWSSFAREWKWLKSTPWVTGLIVAVGVAAPWYWMAERANDGFLKYFFVNENFLRFLKPEYGDRYGKGHTMPYGTIMLIFCAAVMPWTPMLLNALWQAIRKKRYATASNAPVETFLVAWVVAPLVFFSISRNISIPYALPAIPAAAILIGRWINRATSANAGESDGAGVSLSPDMIRKLLNVTALALVALGGVVVAYLTILGEGTKVELAVIATVVAASTAFFWKTRATASIPRIAVMTLFFPALAAYFSMSISDEVGRHESTKDLVRELTSDPRFAGFDIVFFDDQPYSMEFYSGRRYAAFDRKDAQLREALSESDRKLIIIETDDLDNLAEDNRARMTRAEAVGPFEIYLELFSESQPTGGESNESA